MLNWIIDFLQRNYRIESKWAWIWFTVQIELIEVYSLSDSIRHCQLFPALVKALKERGMFIVGVDRIIVQGSDRDRFECNGWSWWRFFVKLDYTVSLNISWMGRTSNMVCLDGCKISACCEVAGLENAEEFEDANLVIFLEIEIWYIYAI